MNTPATQLPGAANPDTKPGEVVVKENPRQVAIDAMTERMEKARVDELNEAIAEDPGLAETQARIDGAIQQSNAEARAAGTLPPDADGAASRVPMYTPALAPEVAPLTPELAADPLAEYIVMDNGVPMFAAKVNGVIQHIPLEQARRQIQIGTAAEVRMQQAAQYEQDTTRNLNERERSLRTQEAALAQRTAAAVTTPVPVQADLTEDDLLDEAREIFNTAFSGTEEDAARKLARTLSKLRAPAPVAQAPVDEKKITRDAARAAVGAIQTVARTKDVRTGYVKFQEDYPDIMGDAKLYKMADDMTDVIARENPSWSISDVMYEAGKRTREWVDQIRGVEPVAPEVPVLTPQIPVTPSVALHPTQTRQERKAGLVRMPQPAAAAVHQELAEVEEAEQTPQEAFAELKAARGQP
jgi:hypothetical protein